MTIIRVVEARRNAASTVAAVLLLCWCATNHAAAQIYYWTTFAGQAGNTNGGDGLGTNAFFNQPSGGAMDAAGNFYVTDEYNDAIRKVAPDGTVSTFAGKFGVPGTNDATGGAARFTQPTNLTFDKDGNMYVVDTYAHTIRKITPAGVVSTLAGLGNAAGFSDGTGSNARFNQPNGIGYDIVNDVLYVADGLNGAIRRVTRSGVVTTIAGGGQAEGQLFYGVEMVQVSPSGRLWVVDAVNSTIWTMDTNGNNQVALAGPGANHTWPTGSGSADGTGSAAQFSYPESLWMDTAGNAFVADYNNDEIRKVTPAGVVTTVGGKPGVIGTADGTNSAARFNLEEGIFVDPWGNLYVCDTQSSTIRVGYAGPPAIASAPQSLVVVTGATAVFTVTAGGAVPGSPYQWQFNGVPLTNNSHVSGAQTNVLTLSNVTTNDIGTYQVTISNIVGFTNASATLMVTQTGRINPVITWTNPASIHYGTALGSGQLNATANAMGSFAYTPAAGTVLSVGTNSLSTVFTPTDMVSYNSATSTVSIVVLPTALTVTATNVTRPYGHANPVLGGTLVGVQNGDNITAAYTTTAVTNSEPGTYPITASLVDPGGKLVNYTVTTNNGVLTVIKATPTIITIPTATSITYGQSLASSTLSGGVASVPGNFAFGNPATLPNAGSALHNVIFTATDTSDYNLVTNTVTVLVSNALLTVTVSNASRLYGVTNPVFSGTIAGIQNGDNITATYNTTATTTSPVGTYPIVPTFSDPNSRLGNYTVTTNGGLLTVNKATPTVTTLPTATSITYGQTLGNSILSGGVASVPGGFAFSNPSTIPDVGLALHNVTFAPTDTVDYRNVTNAVSVLVSPASLSVTASNASRPFGQTNPVLGGTIVGIQNGDDITATYATTATTNSPPGTYPIVPSLVDPNSSLTNYNVTTNNGLLTVSKATPAITTVPTATPITYGQTLASSTLTGGVASVAGTFAFTIPSTAPAAGTSSQSFTFTPADTTDYTNATGVVSLLVTPASLTITASNATKAFGQSKTFAGTEFAASGLLNTDTVTQVTLSSPGAAAAAAVGDYPIVPSGATGIGLTNYTVAYSNGVLTVTPPTPVTLNIPTLLVDGTIKLTFTGGDAGVNYRIQASSNLDSHNWYDLFTNLAGTNGLPAFTDLTATNQPVRFYRTVTP